MTPARLRVGSRVMIVDHSAKCWELTGSAALVLAWVALEGHAERRRLSAMLWPESDARQARSNLRVLVHRINQRFGCELLVGAERLQFDAAQLQVELHDTDAVLAALDGGGAARCELLAEAGLETDAGEQLRAWLADARRRLKRAQLAQLSDALAQALAAALPERAAVLARACVQLDPLSEHRHRQLMEVMVLTGDRGAALSAYEDCKAVLKQYLGVLPDRQTRAVQLRILQDQALGQAQGGPQTLETEGLTKLGGAARYPLVEREAVLERAQDALEQGMHVVVQGEPGVGKTRLLRHLAARAGRDCELVVIRFALKHEPYAAIAQLLQEVQPRRAPCVGVSEQIELARLAPLAFAAVKPSEAALSAPRLHAALRHWLARLGDAGLHMLVLDDVQYADAASQAALASLLQAAAESAERIPAMLLGHRSGDIDAVLHDAVTEAQTRRHARRVDLQRLTPTGVLALLRTMDLAQSTRDPKALAAQLHKRTGGNPLFVIELAQQVLAQGEAADTSSLQALLESSLAACSVPAQQLAAVAAVAADGFTVELAAAVMGLTQLALMPAWRELQQRGLFAGHGLAHDLVQEALLAALPQAILQGLHRQVGEYLEGQGMQGVAVLRHWLAAGDADRALPHAVHRLYAISAAGLTTTQHELEVLGLLERASDPVLAKNLWLTGELDNNLGNALPAQTWQRVRALRQRIERGPDQAAHAAWVAYEAARDHWFLEGSPDSAYQVLAPAAHRMAEQGLERAYVEYELALLAYELTGDPRAHLQGARAALANLPERASVDRLRKEIEDLAGGFLEPVEGMRALSALWRASRRRGDLAMVADTCMRMGYLNAVFGRAPQALRHYTRAARLHAQGGKETESFETPFMVSKIALNAGCYALAQQLMTAGDDRVAQRQRPVHLAVLFLRLGDTRQAEVHMAEVTAEALREHFSAQFTYVHTRAQLDRLAGRDPVPALQEQLHLARELGLRGINLDLLAWELDLQTQTLAERLARGHALLSELRGSGTAGAKLGKALLEIAEVCAEAGAPHAQSLAAEASRLFRRGCANATTYLPDCLVRCATLIRQHDPHEAEALVHVARRWVHKALQHLPRQAEVAFVQNVAVNRLLLCAERQAL